MDRTESAAPLIISLEMDPGLTAVAQKLRNEHFPPAQNQVPAHVTLFHHLPGEQVELVSGALAEVTERFERLPIALSGVRFLGKGVALTMASAELLRVRAELAGRWAEWLTPQDRQPYRPHLTVQNKVPPEVARQLFHRLQASCRPLNGLGEALRLWHYRGGPWEAAGRFAFASGPAGPGGSR